MHPENQHHEEPEQAPLPELPKSPPHTVPDEVAKQIAGDEHEQKAPAKVSFAALDLDELTPEKMAEGDNRPKEMLVDPHTRKKQKISNITLEILFRLGFASIFLVNFAMATLEPQAYAQTIQPNAIVPSWLSTDAIIKIASFNDLFLALFVLSGWKRKWILGWAGAWLIVLAIIRIGHFLA